MLLNVLHVAGGALAWALLGVAVSFNVALLLIYVGMLK